MKKISLIVHEDAVLSAVSGVLDIITHTNRYLRETEKPEAFELELVGEKKDNKLLYVPASFSCYKTLDEVTDTDLILTPAFYGEPDAVLAKNSRLINWIKTRYTNGTEVGSLCSGAYFLAQAGLLTNKACTCHWRSAADLQGRFPGLKVMSDKLMTDQDGIYTSGGAFSSLNLILYLIEKFCGKELSVWASKMFLIDMDRGNQAHFAVFRGQRQHRDDEVIKAQTYIEQNYHLQISVEQIAEKANMSKRNFIRRFKKATQNTPVEYLQRVKIESAKKALETGGQNINSLVYDVGYTDLKTFRGIFKRITGLTPQDYRKKYNRDFQLAN